MKNNLKKWKSKKEIYRLCEICKNFLVWALQKKGWVDGKERWKLHYMDFNDKKYENHSKNVILTNHAKYRISERLNITWDEIIKITEDLKHWITRIKTTITWRFIMYWKLAKYIITKDKVLVTILNYKDWEKIK